MTPGFINVIRGIGGEPELSRVVGLVGAIVYVIGAQIVAFRTDVGLTEYCAAFPGGLLLLGLGTSTAIAIKDRNVASSKIIEQTGAVPTKPLAGPQVPTGKPPPVDDPEPSDAAR